MLVEPRWGLYVPAGQGSHAACPARPLKVPARHALHWGWPEALADPGLQARQLALLLEPANGLKVPGLHSAHPRMSPMPGVGL